MPSFQSALVFLAASLVLTHAQNTSHSQPSPEVINAVLDGIAGTFRANHSLPIQHYPEEAGLAYENVSFSSADGVTLRGWFFPREDSHKIIIANHPRYFNRAGIDDRTPETALFEGNWWGINFIPDYRILHDAGYNILAYDYRNHGEAGLTGYFTSGIEESRDVVASIDYIRNRPDTANMTLGLFSRCNGANSNLHAIRLQPDVFKSVRAMVLAQPVTAQSITSRGLERQNIPLSYIDDVSERIFDSVGYHLDDFAPSASAALVQIPTFVYQVRDDFWTTPADVQSIYDAIPIVDKKLYWITGTDRRWDGYSWFQREPQQALQWFAKFMV